MGERVNWVEPDPWDNAGGRPNEDAGRWEVGGEFINYVDEDRILGPNNYEN